MDITLYNTLTRKKELFTPINKEEITIYACGPTVYNNVHIGNLRTFLVEDVLVRFLAYSGYNVRFVMNFTDVDDKTIRGAFNNKKSLQDFTKEFEKSFLEDTQKLNFLPTGESKVGDSTVNIIRPKATENIPKMIEMIESLLDKGIAYKTEDGSVYFAIDKYKNYGALSGFKQEDLIAGASKRILVDEYEKDTAADFVLWKAEKPEDHGNSWDVPSGAFAKGRPGWHIECSAMSNNELGKSFDIHCGGIDNLFPHHENEIAQSKSCYGGDFAHFFMHVAHLKVDKKKMSKSLGNIYTLSDLMDINSNGSYVNDFRDMNNKETLKAYSPAVIRYALLSTHYKQELFFSTDLLDECKSALTKIELFISNCCDSSGEAREEVIKLIDSTVVNVENALAYDLNIPKAIGFIFAFITEIKKNFTNLYSDEWGHFNTKILKLDEIFGFINLFVAEEKDKIQKIAKHIETNILISSLRDERTQAKLEKNFKRADEIRDSLLKKGIKLIDHKDGTTTWEIIKD